MTRAMLTEAQRVALQAACKGRIRTPNTGGWRRRGGEVDHVACFPRSTVSALVGKGLLAISETGGYNLTPMGRAAVGQLAQESAQTVTPN